MPTERQRNLRTALIAATIGLAMLVGYVLRKWMVG